MDIVFQRQPDAAEGLYCMAHGAPGRAGSEPRRQRDLRAGLRLAVGNRADRLPHEEFGRIDLADQIGHRMRQCLKGADEHAERLALAGIGGRHGQRRARQARQRDGDIELPFLQPGGKQCQRGIARAEHRCGQGGQIEFGNRGGGEVVFRLACGGRHGDQHHILPPARDHCIGDQTAGNPLDRLHGDVMHGDGHHLLASDGRSQQFLRAAKLAEQAGGDQCFGERAGSERAPGLFHHHHGIEQPHTHSAGGFGHAHGEGAEFGQSLPQRGIEAGGKRRAHARRGAVFVEEPRESVAHHFLFVSEIEIHCALFPFIAAAADQQRAFGNCLTMNPPCAAIGICTGSQGRLACRCDGHKKNGAPVRGRRSIFPVLTGLSAEVVLQAEAEHAGFTRAAGQEAPDFPAH